FHMFAGAMLAFVTVMVFVGGLRLSPGALGTEWARRVALTSATLSSDASMPFRVLVGPEPGKGAVDMVELAADESGRSHLVRNANMPLTLVQRTGIIGWALMMWVIGSALAAIYRGCAAVSDQRLEHVLWAIFSSGLGFLVSMSNFNAFYDAPIQIFFWG